MKKRLLAFLVLTSALFAGCSDATPKSYHFNVSCSNCLANLENTLSIDVNENEFVSFKLTSNDGYLLPIDVKITSGEETLVKNKDYIYTIGEDRLSGEVTIKSTKATDIKIDADEQGYLYIGNNKISKSGDYSILDSTQFGYKDASDAIIYDYSTNTLTLFDCLISYKDVGLHGFDFSNDLEYIEFDSDKIDGLIGWTGGGSFTVRLLGENQFFSKGEDNLETVFVAPLKASELHLVGPGCAHFGNSKFSAILNQRGKTFIDNVLITGGSLGFSGIYSKDLFISNSHISLSGTTHEYESYGVRANFATINRSFIETINFGYGIEAQGLTLIDTDANIDDVYVGMKANSINVYGYKTGETYSANISIKSVYIAITSNNSILLNGCNLDCTIDFGYLILIPDATFEAYNSSIRAVSLEEGVGINAFQIWLTNCDVYIKAVIAVFTSLNSDSEAGREFEPNFEINHCNITTLGMVYGNGHFKAENCLDEETYKYLEKEVDFDHNGYFWALCPYSETELQIETLYDDEGRPYYVPKNGLENVEIKAEN